MKTFTLEQVEAEAIKEAVALKNKATKEELCSIFPDRINGASTSNCIYGQMTGNCDSCRALTLLSECAIPVLGGASMPSKNLTLIGDSFDFCDRDAMWGGANRFFSAIETLILLEADYPGEYKEYGTAIGKFLRDETKVLTF